MDDLESLKREVIADIDRLAPMLVEVSRDIHAHPELNYEEAHAHAVLTDALSTRFSRVTRSAFDVETAFHTSHGNENGPGVGVILEYDALPEIGHACGHNVIAAAPSPAAAMTLWPQA